MIKVSLSAALLTASLGLVACATVVISADPSVGYEGKGDRRLRLYMDRVKIEEIDDIRHSVPQLCFECGDPNDLSNAVLFQIPFFASNDTNLPWKLTGDRFAMERLDGDPGELPRSTAIDHGVIVANVAPHSTARFSVLMSLVGSDGIEDVSDLNATYRLTVRDEEDGMLLDRTLSIGYFSQPKQLAQFAGVFVVSLLLLGLI